MTDQVALISADPRVMHGQAVIAGTRVPISVILDCPAALLAKVWLVAAKRTSDALTYR